ncbi:Rne/Rng family ribonuclease [Actinoplanes sp. NEAU-A12]|uniref:Rne/Rng family ribonuclease n=1 Tax=Actinoplanes sandaracinus TaxID=3045177 RepID=A0ABT6WEZ3_9ACTN|nr:Rne/Rng family ribonuclease [Actinoplanes sandaracinus]MDI6098287.1 Rne/Rng family ribonuclease [Actinoplanes sandaracinus]
MLDNEPPVNLGDQGGERDGVTTPPADAAAGTTPARRTRAPRRKAVAPPPEADTPGAVAGQVEAGPATEPGAAIEAAAVAGDGEAPAAPVKKATRARRKKVEPALEVPAEAPAETSVTADVPAEEPAEAPAAPVKKATRARRKKVEPAAEQPALIEAPAAEQAPEPSVPDAPVAEVSEEDEAALIEDAAVEAAAAARAAGAPVVGILPLDDDFVEEQPAKAPRARRAALPPAVLFMPPEATQAEPAPVGRRRRPVAEPLAVVAEAPAAELSGVEETVAEEPVAEEAPEVTRRSRRRRRGAAEEPAEVAVTETEPVLDEVDETDENADDAEDGSDEDGDDDDEDGGAGRRRRRRGRRGRGRGKGPSDEADEGDAEEPEGEEGAEASADEGEDDEESEETEGDGVTRRRRRRRRKGSSGDGETGGIEDGVHTVVRVREPRRSDEVQGVSGSTRLEAKRQRRRDGREQRRTRPPILSESEFLARREAVDRVMVVRQKSDRLQIAVLEDGILVEHYVARATSGTMVGNVYLGKVQNVLPSMEAAFVDVGRGRNAVLYAGEVNWDATGLEGRARSIEQALRSGDSVLVQVTKDPIGHKGARLTSHIALSGRHLVYVPNGNASGISRKLPDNERKRLRDILKKMVPDGAGVIVRTAAEGATEDELARDVKRLQAQWEDIQARAAEGNAPRALSEEPDLVIRVVRDLFNEDFRELVVQGEQAYAEVENYLESVSPDLVERLHRHTGVNDVFAEHRIDEQIMKGLDRKVFLPSGGHLVIDRTEAMTVVDVNTGKYTGAGGNLEETVTRNNLEAAEEIVRQLRLRDLGGIVVIDFIDMVLESNRDLVLRRLTECLGRDRTKHQVTEITSLGLVQMTRKRIGAGLLEAFSENCDHCKGRGVLIHPEPVPEKRSNGGGGNSGGGSGGNSGGAGSQVKVVAASARTEAPAQQQQQQSTRQRRRRGGGDNAPVEQPVEVVEAAETVTPPEASEVAAAPAAVAPAAVAPVTVPSVTVTEVAADAGPAAEVAEVPPAPVAGSGIVRRTQPSPPATADDDEYDISGYDLSRYDVPADANGTGPEAEAEPMRLAGADDPDAADEDDDEDEDDDVVGAGAGTRRRSRRSGARRRTRP